MATEGVERPPLDPSRCGFCRWFDPLRDSEKPRLDTLSRLHLEIHRLAEALYSLQDAGQIQQAKDRLPELYAQRDALLEEIEHLLGCPSTG